MDYSKVLSKIKPSEEDVEKVSQISTYVIAYFKKLIPEAMKYYKKDERR